MSSAHITINQSINQSLFISDNQSP